VKLTLNDQVRHEDGSLTVTGIELTVLPGAGENLDRVLTSDERAALPELTGLLGTELPAVNTVGDLVNGVTEGLGVQVDPSRPVQTITVGSATCSAGDGDADGAGNGDDDGNGNGDDNGDDNGDGDDAAEVAAVGVAPAPQVMDASLPVTG
jgi:hypothetical protein